MDMMLIRLDFLQNPPLDSTLNALLLKDFNFNSIALKNEASDFGLKARFNKNEIALFSFSIGGFIELFLHFKRIYFAPSLHFSARAALDSLNNIIEIHELNLGDLKKNLLDLDSSLNPHLRDETLIILPSINEDIFSQNEIPKISNATLALDISYECRLGEFSDIGADILLLNSAVFGLINNLGLIIANKKYTKISIQNGLLEAFSKALDKKIKLDSSNKKLFSILKNELGKNIDVFCQNYAPNTLPLRFRHINTRFLIEHLYLEDIFISPNYECQIGLYKPSNVLKSLGFGEMAARELCAISFERLENVDFVAEKLINAYKIILLMEF